jgi:tetratricopeptide (TPR) repeat protein
MSRLVEFQEKLSEKVKGNFLLHLLINDIKFLIAFIALTPIAIGGVLLIPKIWEITPDHISPKIKVSGLDFIQSWALARTARQHENQGDFDAALYSWEAAISNHPTKTKHLRAAIASYLKLEHPTAKQISRNLNYSTWLLRLNQTNFNDLELVVETLDRSRLDQLQYSLLMPLEPELTESMRAAYSRSLFNLLKYQEFNEQWQKLSEPIRRSPANVLYGTAYTALRSSSQEAEESKLKLEKSLTDSGSSLLAKQLLLLVYFHRKDDTKYENILGKLILSKQARYSHHLGYWTLLTQLDKTDQALKLASDHSEKPIIVEDLINHVTLLRGLGAPEMAHELIQNNIESFPRATSLYSAYADLLIDLLDWDRLREIAITLRKLNTDDNATSLSYYLEGTADAKQIRNNAAEKAFKKFSTSASENGIVSKVSIAKELFQFGFPNHALTLLKQVEPKNQTNATYWHTKAGFAFQQEDFNEMKLASEKALSLEPTNTRYKSSLVESLLNLREEPARAIRLTLELASKNPNSFSHHINHVIALTLNRRVKEAAELLRQIPVESAPNAQARATFYYAKFSIEFLENDYEKAMELAPKVPEELLSIREREWFNSSIEIISKQL